MPTLNPEFTIICDEVRREAFNKIAFLGVYNEDVRLADIPGLLKGLYIVQRWRDVPKNKVIRVKILGFNKEMPEIKVPKMDEKKNVDLIIGFQNLEITSESEITIMTYFGIKTKTPVYKYKFSFKKALKKEFEPR